ncbi:uncharacterized protein [Nothobranchius furzeri]|uniref:uncharacterized protein isoform X2 n=1 Tax=Nothobranchius furzeri TaxID=105023 RepID=UPI00390498F6
MKGACCDLWGKPEYPEKTHACMGRTRNSTQKDPQSCRWSLTAGVWTSRVTEVYHGVSCYFLSEDWKMKRFNLATMPLVNTSHFWFYVPTSMWS